MQRPRRLLRRLCEMSRRIDQTLTTVFRAEAPEPVPALAASESDVGLLGEMYRDRSLWQQSGHDRPDSPELWPLPGQDWPTTGRNSAELTQIWKSVAMRGRGQHKRNSPKTGQTRSKPRQRWPRPNKVRSTLGHVLAELSRRLDRHSENHGGAAGHASPPTNTEGLCPCHVSPQLYTPSS